VKNIQANKVWSTGNYGDGIVVASIDSGVRYTHKALVNNYRGNIGSGSFDHDYNWFDPYYDYTEPFDTIGHGTHTMGILAGSGGIGVAPGATWFTARGCKSRSCEMFALLSAAQFVMCPTRVDGTHPDCSLAPDIVSNSWSSKSTFFYYDIVQAWRKAGIIPVFAISNNGPFCSTVASPGNYQSVFGVGATDINNRIAALSARGPSQKMHGLKSIKPDIVAPGKSILSAWSTSDRALRALSGTSMSTPFVAGAIALYLKDNPNSAFQQIYNSFVNTASRTTIRPIESCGLPKDIFPNNVYGYGLINIEAAIQCAGQGGCTQCITDSDCDDGVFCNGKSGM